jgi:hypothetical protein
MSNTLGTDILIQADAPMEAAGFYVQEIGFEITDKTSNQVSLHGRSISCLLNEALSLDPSWKLPSNVFRKPKPDCGKRLRNHQGRT